MSSAKATQATRDLTVDRSLLPDLFALPGYVLFGVASLRPAAGAAGARRVRGVARRHHARCRGVAVRLRVVDPADAPSRERVGDGPDRDRYVPRDLDVPPRVGRPAGVLVGLVRRPSRCCSGGTACLLVGDVVFALGDAGRIVINERLLEVPFLLVPAAIGSAVLHPSIRVLARPARRSINTMSRGPSVRGRGRPCSPPSSSSPSTTCRPPGR